MPNLITSAQAGRILGKTVSAVNRDAQLGYLPFVLKLPGKTGAYLFDRDLVEAKAAKRDEQASA